MAVVLVLATLAGAQQDTPRKVGVILQGAPGT
jgi:hypothetical protein